MYIACVCVQMQLFMQNEVRELMYNFTSTISSAEIFAGR